MAPTKTHSTRNTPRGGMNKWTYEQRLCLDELWNTRTARLSLKDRARVFNTIFQDHLAACGVTDGLNSDSISAQYTMRLYTDRSSWKTSWERVCALPKLDLDLRLELQRRIDDVLQRGETIQVQRPATPPETPRRTERVRRVTQNPYDSYDVQGPVTPVRQRFANGTASSRSNVYATPGPNTRKRPAATTARLLLEIEDDELAIDEEEYVPQAKRVRRSSPTVVIPPLSPESAMVRTPKTPQSRYKSGGREGATIPYERFFGSTIMLKPHEYHETQQPLRPINEHIAHPKTMPALLFRYWDEKSHGLNSDDGFVCGLFKSAIVQPGPPPACDALEWNYIAQHLNNGGSEKNGTPSPFISTSNLWVWVVRMALKRSQPTSRISVIDTSKLDPKSVFWVLPFHEELKRKRPFTKGGFIYRGSHEHLIWDRINASAIIKTFSLTDLINFANSDNAVKAVLRLDAVPSCSIKELKQANIPVNSRVADAIAETVMFLGLDHTSTWETLSQAVSEVVQGWALKVDGASQDKAGVFVQAFWRKSGTYIETEDQFKLKHAFYSGLHWSCGDLNARLKGNEGYKKMKSNASKKGLTEPDTALASELDRAKLQLILRAKRQERLHLLPLDGAADDEEEEDLVDDPVGQLVPGLHRLLPGDEIVYE